jgi:hypothetical protein
MAGSDAKQVIVDYLSKPSVVVWESQPREHGWREQIRRGGRDADASTIQFVKERGLPGRQLHAVTFESGLRQRMFVYVVQDDSGDWHVRGAAGGGMDGGPVRDHPWVNLGGGGWPAQFFMGGTVHDHGLDVARVRLVGANGTTVEDTVDDGLVLFITAEPVEAPIQVELLDRNGALVGQHPAFDYQPRRGHHLPYDIGRASMRP